MPEETPDRSFDFFYVAFDSDDANEATESTSDDDSFYLSVVISRSINTDFVVYAKV